MIRKLLVRHGSPAAVLVVFLLTFIYMLPLHDETWQDDWAYVKTVQHFWESGQLKINEWSAASFIFPTFWGALFSEVLGFSPKVLHLSTIFLFFIALIFFYQLLRQLRISPYRSAFFTLVLLANPWIFNFSYTFLSDVPYISLMIISLCLFIKALQSGKLLPFVIGSFVAGLAMLTRQIGASIVISILLILIYRSYREGRVNIFTFIAVLTPFLVLALWYTSWLSQPGNMTISQYQSTFPALKEHTLPHILPLNLGHSGTTQLLYAQYIRRILFYSHHLIGFLLPFFFIFSLNLTSIITALKRYRSAIVKLFLVYLLFLGLEIFFHFGSGEPELSFPSLILRYDNLSPIGWERWKTVWKIMVILSVLIWIPLLAARLQRLFTTFFKRRIGKNFLLKPASIIGLTLLLIYYLTQFPLNSKAVIPAMSDLLTYLRVYSQIIFTQDSLSMLSNSWLVLPVVGSVFYLFIYLLTNYSPIKDRRVLNYPILFLALSFLIQMGIIIFVMWFTWPQYMIANIPLMIIFMAYISRSWKINKIPAVIILLLMLSFSVSLTKNRYVNLGIQWEMGTKLVEMGVRPSDIDVDDESWIRWHYAESTMAEAIKEHGGNKYLVRPTNTWTTITPSLGVSYSFIRVPSSFTGFSPEEGAHREVVLDSGLQLYSLLSKIRHVAFRSID